MTKRRRSILVCLVAVLVVAGTVVWYVDRPKILYRVTFLPSMGGVETDPHAINDSGRVAAVVRGADSTEHVVLWDKSDRTEDLASFPKGYYVVRLCLNNADQIAGTVFDPNRVWSSFFRDADGRTCALDAPGGGEVQMRALNNRGQVVGHWNRPRGPHHAFLWDKTSGMRDLGTFAGLESLACDINDKSQIVGFYSARGSQWRAFLCDPNLGMQELGLSRFGPDATCCINNQGFIAGQFGSATDEYYVSIWTAGAGPQRVGSAGGRDYLRVCGLDDANRYFLNTHHRGIRLLRRQLAARWEAHLWESDRYIRCIDRHLGRAGIESVHVRGTNKDGTILALLATGRHPHPQAAIIEPIER
ncbi:MAG TPA: hypothetical protein PKH24_02755 [Sedimentisphaerales bacterium]|jgi:probable HAF family extracellular repeat protein|nr:hypothetical protein [Sedimentisphaerales bacterium]HNU27977.1 hypothetical protein [Sedimentisphaerales bacterium]